MAVNVAWDNTEKTILRYSYQGSWTWDEYNQAVHTGLSLAASVQHRFDLVADFTQCKTLPRNVLSMFRKVLTNQRTMPPNMRLIVLVANSPFLDKMINMFRNINRDLAKQFCVVRTVEAAHELISLQPEVLEQAEHA